VGFVAFFAWLGFGGDYIYHLYTLRAPHQAYHHDFPWFGIALSLVALLLAWYAYKTGPDKVLWSTGAREVIEPQGPKEQQLVNVVEEMAIAAGVPRPRIWRGSGGGGGGGSRSEDRKGGPLLLILLVAWIVSWLLAPIIAQLLALGVSRKREYLADAMSAQFTRNPLALASALQKIEGAE